MGRQKTGQALAWNEEHRMSLATSRTGTSISADTPTDGPYAPLSAIKREMEHYGRPAFEGKVVLCNCNDPHWSNFWRFFAERFAQYGLRKLISTRYKLDGRPSYALIKDASGEKQVDLCDNGDFRSPECMAFLREADIVATYPPFALFREFLASLIDEEKKFAVIGNQWATTYKEVFPLIRDERCWIGASGLVHEFETPVAPDNPGHERITSRASGASYWFTNMPHKIRAEGIEPVQFYEPRRFPRYDNFDAIEVSRVRDIPRDWKDMMGVPITYLSKHCPDRFEIVGLSEQLSESGGFTLNGRRVFKRVVIRNRKPEKPEASGEFSQQDNENDGLDRDDRRHYEDRIEYLRYEAEQDGFNLNSDSEGYFWRFVKSVCRTRRAYLFLLDNGNLRAVWKDENDAQVGLQFRADGMVQYVIFARCAPEDEITPAYGRVSIDTAIMGQIEGFDLRPLVGA